MWNHLLWKLRILISRSSQKHPFNPNLFLENTFKWVFSQFLPCKSKHNFPSPQTFRFHIERELNIFQVCGKPLQKKPGICFGFFFFLPFGKSSPFPLPLALVGVRPGYQPRWEQIVLDFSGILWNHMTAIRYPTALR